MPDFTRHCWFLTGPTATGKSRAAVMVAERLNCEIIAMDSMTLYRGMDIGTDKPSDEDRARVAHHLVDVFDPHESASLDLYLRLAESAVADVRSRGRQPLFVGGTPLYLKACLRGIFVGPPADPAFRESISEEADRSGLDVIFHRLAQIDPVAATKILPGDRRRIIRALEVFEKTGRPISEWQQEFDRPANPRPPVACLVRSRDERHDHINRRVEIMLRDGWIDEVRTLKDADLPMGKVASQAVGYAEIIEHLEGRLDAERMLDLIQTRTRQLSKRQMTWFRHIDECVFIETSRAEPLQQLVERLVEFYRANRLEEDGEPLAADAPPAPQ